MKYITKSDIIKAINTLEEGDGSGTVYQKITTLDDGRDLCIVFGYVEGYDEGEAHQKKIGDTFITLCAKIAINIDDLQCDYDYDWYEPYNEDGDIYATDMAITDGSEADYFNQEAKFIADMLNQGKLQLA